MSKSPKQGLRADARFPNDSATLDPRVKRTRRAVGQALMGLLAEGRRFGEISISELALRAGVTRKTFYAHFQSTDAVVRAMADDLFRGILAAIDDAAFRLPLAESRLGREIFAQLTNELDVLAPLVTLCPSALFLEPARTVVEQGIFERIRSINHLGPIGEFEQAYLAQLSSSALHGALTTWSERGFRDHPDNVASILMQMLAPLADRIFATAASDP